MISKIFITGQGFGETCGYVSEDLERAEVLAVEGVRGHDHRLMGKDFETQHGFRPEKEKAVFHGVLSFPHGEDPGDGRLVEIARKYLDVIGMRNTQYAIVKHRDKEHLHLHVLANRVDNEGGIIGKGLIIERGIKAAQQLTAEYGLKPEKGKNLAETNLEALHAPDAKRYRLFIAIREDLPGCTKMADLEKKLLERGITMRYRIEGAGGKRVGVSFCIEGQAFKGSRVDAAYSLKGLEQALAEQQRQAVQQQLEREAREKRVQELFSAAEKEMKERQDKKPKQEREPRQETAKKEQVQEESPTPRRGIRIGRGR
jgi:hypothetical protein